MQKYSGLEIAVVGMAGRFPGADNIDIFWENIKNGKESITRFSDEELKKSGIEVDLLNNPLYVKANGAINSIDKFDNHFFEYTPKEAGLLEPQVRIFHECCWEALEDAGCNPDTFNGLIGLYAGASEDLKWKVGTYINLINVSEQFEAKNFLRNSFTTLVSYKLNLRGPSYSLNTACSTSLVAVHLACQALLSGECDLSLAGGTTIIPPMNSGYMYQEGMIFSPDGHCRAFDAKANGTIFGNGSGVVALKRLEDAINDNDSIYAVIKGSAINNDGLRKVGYTAPSVEGQAEVIIAAHQIADVDPESIGYVETHGTGTNLGDPVEIEGLKLAFNSNKKGFCAIGSVKPNIGHLDITAGVAGFIKTILSLKHKKIPPSINFDTPNPNIDFENSPFYVNISLQDWKSKDILRAGVSSFGIGGTNAHVILEEAPEVTVSPGNRRYHMIMLSAKSTNSLKKARENMITFLQKKNQQMPDIAYTLQVGRKEFQYKSVCTCSNVNEAIENLSRPMNDDNFSNSVTLNSKTSVIFMFSGQGSQYVNMGLELYETESFFKSEVDKCFKLIEKFSDFNYKNILYHPIEIIDNNLNDLQINQTANTQPLLFIIEYSLARLLMHWGVKPDAMIGHSIGEYVAACIADVISLEDSLKLVVERGKLIQKMPKGSMLAVQLSVKDLKPLLIEGIEIAVQNSSGMSVVGGNESCIESFTQVLESKNVIYSKLHTSHAFHTHMMEPILKEFEECVRNVKLNKPQIPYVSNVTGKWITEEEVTTPLYWAKHIRNTVRFSDGINELSKINGSVYIEVGPGKSLCNLVKLHYNNNKEQKVFNLLKHPYDKKTGDFYLIDALSKLWLLGVSIDWTKYYEEEKRKKVNLPTYSFDRKSFISDHSRIVDNLISGTFHLNKGGLKKRDLSEWFYIPSWKQITVPKFNNKIIKKKVFFFINDNFQLTELVDKLQKDEHEIIIVKQGRYYEKTNNQYILNPAIKEDYYNLIDDIKDINEKPCYFVHCWNIDSNISIDIQDYDQYLNTAFYSLIYLAQALGRINLDNSTHIDIITDNLYNITGIEKINPLKSLLLGPINIIPHEYPNITCRNIDITDNSNSNTSINVKIIYDLFYHTDLKPSIIIRGKNLWERVYDNLKPENINYNQKISIKENGVYLITGGAGDIGLTIARYFAQVSKAKLILVGRSDIPSFDNIQDEDMIKLDDTTKQKVQEILKLKELGAEILYYSADVADEEKMISIINSSEKLFGRINGIVHAAGVPGGGIIQQKNKETTDEVFLSKVKGTLVLENIFKNKKLDFFLLFSSISSIIPAAGQSDYYSANAFLDSFAEYKSINNDPITLSVNWDAWQSLGMAERAIEKSKGISDQQRNKLREQLKRNAIHPKEALKVFDQILNINEYRVIISTTDLKERIRIIKNKEFDGKDDISNDILVLKMSRPEMSISYKPPRNELDERLSEIWSSLLGIDGIGIDDDFYELGGDSLKSINLSSSFEKEFGFKIPLDVYPKYSTIQTLSDYINENYSLNYHSNVINNEIDIPNNDRIDIIEKGKGKLKKLKKLMK